MSLSVEIARTVPRDTDVVGVPVASEGTVPRTLGLSRAALAAHGFDGKPGQILVLPAATGPTLIAVGIGNPKELTVAALRNAAASLARAASKRARLATTLGDLAAVDSREAAQALVEGVMLAAYRYVELKADKSGASKLERLTLVVGAGRAIGATAGAELGVATAGATRFARDLANSPPAHLTARMMADHAVELFWLSVLGPSATWLLRRIVDGFEAYPEGYEIDLVETAAALGLSFTPGKHGPFPRALQRCVLFGLASNTFHGLAVRRLIPPLSTRHLDRLPSHLRAAHQQWITAERPQLPYAAVPGAA